MEKKRCDVIKFSSLGSFIVLSLPVLWTVFSNGGLVNTPPRLSTQVDRLNTQEVSIVPSPWGAISNCDVKWPGERRVAINMAGRAMHYCLQHCRWSDLDSSAESIHIHDCGWFHQTCRNAFPRQISWAKVERLNHDHTSSLPSDLLMIGGDSSLALTNQSMLLSSLLAWGYSIFVVKILVGCLQLANTDAKWHLWWMWRD